MKSIPFPAIVAGQVDGLTFETLDRPFEGVRPVDPSWGTPPAAFDAWFCQERGPEAAGIIAIEQPRLFGSDLVYLERGGELQALSLEQNFLSEVFTARALARMEERRAAGILRTHDVEGEVVLLSGFPYVLYGHWMVDFMPRLELLRASGRDLARLRFLLPADLPTFAHEWLTLAGVRPDQIVLYDQDAELCLCERALLPTNLRLGGRALPSMGRAAKWMTRITCAEDVDPIRLLYVSRESWGNTTRCLDNSCAVEAVMTEHGFEVVYPERLAIPDQARLLASARIVAGDYGSGLHNTIFSRAETSVIALRGTYLHPGFLQSGLCEVRHQPLFYLFGRTWGNERESQRYEIDLGDLCRCLDAIMTTLG